MELAATEKSVLIVDDEPEVRQFVRAVLSRQGYEVLEAEDGVAGYDLLRRKSGGIRLLVTDVQMPRMDGITLGQKVRNEYPDVKVLYISGFFSERPEQFKSGEFLPKPFRPDALVRSVRNLDV